MGANLLSPGVNVRENASGVIQIRGVPKSVGGFIIRALRGPVGKPVRITSFLMAMRIFGGYDPSSYGMETIKAFYDNAGNGAPCYIVRVLGSSSGSNAKAAVTLSSTGAASSGSLTSGIGPFALLAGDTFSEKVDGAGAVVKTITATAASKTGAAASFAAGAGGDSVTITIANVPGGANQLIDLSAAVGSEAGYLASINAQLIGGSAVDSAGQLQIVTDQKGSGAAGSIVSFGGAGAAKTGLAAGAFTGASGNVANVEAVLASELCTVLALAGSTFTPNANGSFTWASNTTGGGSSVQFSAGAYAKIGSDNAVHSGSASSSVNVGTWTAVGEGSDCNIMSALVTAENTTIGTPNAGLGVAVAVGSPTSFTLSASTISRISAGDQLRFTDTVGPQTVRGIVKQIQGNVVLFTAAITVGGAGLAVATTSIVRETFSYTTLYSGIPIQGPIKGNAVSPLSLRNYYVNKLGKSDPAYSGANILTDEYPVDVADALPAFTGLDQRPVNTNSLGDSLTGGSECTTFADVDWIGQNGSAPFTGVYALDKTQDIRLLAIPGISGTTPGAVSTALITYCENRTSLVAIVAPALGTSPANAATYKSGVLGSSTFGICYFPWIQILNALSSQKSNSPPEGSVMGMIVRTDTNSGIQEAPAGTVKGKLQNAIGVEQVISDGDRDLLYPLNVNTIESIDNVGVCVNGSRTMGDGAYNQIHVRRTFIYLEQSLKLGLRDAIFGPNTPAGRAKVKRSTDQFLSREWKLGTLTGTTQDDAFTSKCDEDNNPGPIVAANQMVEDVNVNIPGTTENLTINIGPSPQPAVAA